MGGFDRLEMREELWYAKMFQNKFLDSAFESEIIEHSGSIPSLQLYTILLIQNFDIVYFNSPSLSYLGIPLRESARGPAD